MIQNGSTVQSVHDKEQIRTIQPLNRSNDDNLPELHRKTSRNIRQKPNNYKNRT